MQAGGKSSRSKTRLKITPIANLPSIPSLSVMGKYMFWQEIIKADNTLQGFVVKKLKTWKRSFLMFVCRLLLFSVFKKKKRLSLSLPPSFLRLAPIISAQSPFFPHFPSCVLSLSFPPPISHFPEMRGCIHGNKGEVGAGGGGGGGGRGGGGGCKLGSLVLHGC